MARPGQCIAIPADYAGMKCPSSTVTRAWHCGAQHRDKGPSDLAGRILMPGYKPAGEALLGGARSGCALPSPAQDGWNSARAEKRERRYRQSCRPCRCKLGAYPIDKNTYVLVDEQELKSLAPAASRTIDVSRFVPSDALSLKWYDRPYFLGPDANQEKHYHAACSRARGQSNDRYAKWSCRPRIRAVAPACLERAELLVTLHHSNEVIAASELDLPPSSRDLLAEEKKLAITLVSSLAGFEPGDFRWLSKEATRLDRSQTQRQESAAVAQASTASQGENRLSTRCAADCGRLVDDGLPKGRARWVAAKIITQGGRPAKPPRRYVATASGRERSALGS